MGKRRAKWVKGDWCRRVYEYKGWRRVAEGYEVALYIDDMKQVSFVGVPDFNAGVFRLRAMIRFPYGYIPKVRELPFGAEGKEFFIEI